MCVCVCVSLCVCVSKSPCQRVITEEGNSRNILKTCFFV